MSFRCIRFSVLILCSLIAIITTSNKAHAESLHYTSTLPTTYTNWTDNFTFPQFDPTIGILTGIEISSTSEMSGSIRYENTTNRVITVSGSISGDVLVSLPNSDSLLVTGKVFSGTTSGQVFDGNLDFRGTSAGNFEYRGEISNSIKLVDSSNIAPFFGTGVVYLSAEATSGWNATGGSANFALLLVNVASANAYLQYNYEIPQIELEKLVNGHPADNANGNDVPLLVIGSTVTWTYLVTNTGTISVPLGSVTVTDSQSGVTPVRLSNSDAGNDGLLAPGESWTYIATAIVQNLESPTEPVTIVSGCNPGGTVAPGERQTYQNIGTVIVPGNIVTDSAHYCNSPRPAIEITKLTNDADANTPNGADVPTVALGRPITWTYWVTNTGNITFSLTQVNVSDSDSSVIPQFDATSDRGNDGLLSPSERWRYWASGQAVSLESPSVQITVVSGCNPTGTNAPGERMAYKNVGFVTVPGADDSDPSHYCNPMRPAVEIVKLTNSADANTPNEWDVPEIAPGTSVTWTYWVTNTGNITFSLAQVNVSDSDSGVIPQFDATSDRGNDQLLSPGERWRYWARGQAVDLSSPPQVITIVAGCNPQNSTIPGSRNSYKNIGFVTVPGATDSDPSHYCNPLVPGIEIIKLTNGVDANNPHSTEVPQISPGALVKWTYLITNTGTQPFLLAEIEVKDSQSSILPIREVSSDTGNDGILASGESWRYTATGIAVALNKPPLGVTTVQGCNPDGDIIPGEQIAYRNIGTVIVPGATDSDPSHYCNPRNPGIEIVKLTNGYDANDANAVDVPQISPKSSVVWTYLVTNTGDVSFAVNQVVVADSQRSIVPLRVLSSDANNDDILSPGESWHYIALGIAENLRQPATEIDHVMGCNPNGTVVPGDRPAYRNVGTVTVPGATDSDPSHYCNPPIASINIENTVYGGYNREATCPGQEHWIDMLGAPISYCFEIKNTGKTYLDSLQFADPSLGITLTHLFSLNGSTPLAPGETGYFYFDATVPDTFLENLAYVEANPIDDQGNDIPGLSNVLDTDPSQVSPVPTNSEESEEPQRVLFLPLVTR